MRNILFVLCLCILLITGCTKTINYSKEDMINKIIKENNYIIVDVRTKNEYDSGHIKGAINIPYDTINEEIELDKEKTILLYCKSGVRSSKAYKLLKELNYNVIDLGSYENAKKMFND